jgi:hypothetical protein
MANTTGSRGLYARSRSKAGFDARVVWRVLPTRADGAVRLAATSVAGTSFHLRLPGELL